MSAYINLSTMKIPSEEEALSQQNIAESNLEISEKLFFSLPTQGSIYTVSSLASNSCQSVIIIGTLHKIYCLQYEKDYIINEIDLPFLASESDIAAISVMPNEDEDSFVLGIVQIKRESQEKLAECMFWFCTIPSSTVESLVPVKFDSLSLAFLPYQLYATHSVMKNVKESVWLLSGSDWSVHLLRNKGVNIFEETNADIYFPELSFLPDICLYMDIQYSTDLKMRTSIFGSESGNVNVFHVDVSFDEAIICASQNINWDFPISSARLFYLKNDVKFCGSDVDDVVRSGNMSALITTTLEGCYVYGDCLADSGNLLINSALEDVVTCSLVCDIDFDGENEVIIGTFGKVVTIYDHSTSKGWTILKTLTYSSPVTAILYEDVTDSGVRDLIVVTNSGVHIYEHDSTHCLNLIKRRLQAMTKEELSPYFN